MRRGWIYFYLSRAFDGENEMDARVRARIATCTCRYAAIYDVEGRGELLNIRAQRRGVAETIAGFVCCSSFSQI